ncbi:MAG: DUF6452 family protein [Prevotella sp.]|nr:DUF6452 family protein [Prevotella sp.]MDD5895988.1 DUF6452 family protein [Prevotellaceae bacterium]
MRRLIPAIALAAMLTACTSVDCPVENVVATYYKALKADGKQDTLRDTLTVMTRLASGKDSVILNRSVATMSFQLPVSFANEADTFTFIRMGTSRTIVDTVCIEKTNLPQFESVDCNLVYFHDVLNIRHTRHGIDSISIKKARIDYEKTDNFHIHFKSGI